MPALAECGLSPSYVDSTIADQLPPQLLRWRDFPVRAYLDTDGVPTTLRPGYEHAITSGAESWYRATGGKVGAIRWVSDAAEAQIQLRIRLKDQWVPGRTLVEVSGRELLRATTDIERPPSDVDAADKGPGGHVHAAVSRVVSHEMGHALGIMLHSPNVEDLMFAAIRLDPGGQSITPADRHTLYHAYCQ